MERKLEPWRKMHGYPLCLNAVRVRDYTVGRIQKRAPEKDIRYIVRGVAIRGVKGEQIIGKDLTEIVRTVSQSL